MLKPTSALLQPPLALTNRNNRYLQLRAAVRTQPWRNGSHRYALHLPAHGHHPLTGPCGDPRSEVGGLWYNVGGGRPTGTYTRGGTMQVEVKFTAFHKVGRLLVVCVWVVHPTHTNCRVGASFASAALLWARKRRR